VVIMDSRHPLDRHGRGMLDWFAPTGKPVHVPADPSSDKLSRQQSTKTLNEVRLWQGDASEPLEDFRRSCGRSRTLHRKGPQVVSFWTMRFNQHVRGTWVNEQNYAIHLLLGKQSQPGNGPSA